MTTLRAKRMKRYLEDLGWEVETPAEYEPCKKCGSVTFRPEKFCSNCGTRRAHVKEYITGAQQLEEAIAYALGETKRKKP